MNKGIAKKILKGAGRIMLTILTVCADVLGDILKEKKK